MSADQITPERIAEIAAKQGYLNPDEADELLDALTASRAEVQRLTERNVSMEAEIRILTEEARRLREIEVSEECYGMLTAHGSDGTMLVCGEFNSGREFREKYRVARRSDAGRVEVPELTEDDIDAIQDAWPGLEQDDPHHYFTIHEHGVREGYKLACSRLSPSPQPAIQIAHIGDSMRDSLQPDGSVLTERWTKGEPVERVVSQPSADVVVVPWISVEDRLPEDGQSVAFVTKCDRDPFYHGRVLGGRYTAGEFGGFSVPGLMSEASHWLPLPPAPDALRSSTNHDAQDAGEGR